MRKVLTALSLAIALANTKPMISSAYSNDKLDNFEDQLEDYINKEIETEKYEHTEEENNLEFYYRYIRIQKLIQMIPTEYYCNLVDNINTSNTLKKVLKACIDDTMEDAAKESIVYANIAENDQEVLNEIMVFFESRDNGNSYVPSSGKLRDYYSLKDIHTLDNCDNLTNIKDDVLVFKDFTSYGDYRIYDITDYSSYYGDVYYFITTQDNKVLACVKRIDEKNHYVYLEQEEIYIVPLEKCLEANDLESEIKIIYTSEELKDLNPKLKNKQSKSNDNIKLNFKINS